MESINPIKYSDLVKADNSISDLIKQLQELQSQFAATSKTIKDEAAAITASLKQTSSASEQGRKQTTAAAEAAEKLAAEERKLAQAKSENAKRIAELKRQQTEANRIAKLTAQLNASKKGSYNALSAEYSLNKIRLNKMTEAERQAAEQSEKLISRTNQLYETMKRLQAETGKHQLNVGNYSSALSGLGGAMKSLGGNVTQLASGLGVSGLGGALTGMSAAAGPVGVAVAGVAALGTAMVSGIDTAREYQHAVSALQAITGTSAKEIEALTKQARQLGATTTYTATEVVQLQTELAKLGYEQKDILNMTDSVLYFAQATGASLAEASSMTGAALRMFEADTTRTQEFVDKLAASTTKSALSFSYLDTALSIVSPVANAFGFQIEDVLALVGQLANAGFDASSAATATRNILLNLADANGDLAKSIGHPVKNLDELVDGLKALDSQGIDLARSLELSDKRSVAAFNTFLRGAESVKTLRDALNDATGTAEDMAHTMGDNLEGDIKSLGSAWDDFMLEINEGQGILRLAVQWLTEVIRTIAATYKDLKEYFTELYNESEDFRIAVVLIYEAVSSSVKSIGYTIKNLVQTIWGLGQMIWGVLRLDWDMIKKGWENASTGITNQAKDIADNLVNTYNDARRRINNMPPIVPPIVSPITSTEKTGQTTNKSGGQGEGSGERKNIKTLDGKEYDLEIEEEAEEYEKALKAHQAKMAKMAEEARKKRLQQAEKAKRDAEALYRSELSTRRSAEDAQLQLIEDSFQKRTIQTNLQYSRQIEDLKHRLDTEENLSTVSRENINAQIAALEQQQTNAIIAIEEERYVKELELQKKAVELKLQTVKEGSEQEKELLLQQNKIAKEIAVTTASPEQRKDVAAAYDIKGGEIADKYLQQQLAVFDSEQKLAQSEFDLLQTTENKKTEFRLQAEKARWQKILELNEQANTKMSDVEVQTIQNTIAKIEQELQNVGKGKGDGDIYDLLGISLDEKQKDAINTSLDYAKEALQNYMDAYEEAANKKVESADREVDAAQSALETELSLREKGYANDVATAQKELQLAKRNQEKALREQEKAQRAQRNMDTIMQASNLVTATAKIWGQLGFPWAIPAIAVMWGSFAASKIKAAQVTKEQYGEGTVEYLHGGSHQSGNDVDLGVKPDGTRRRAEGGEYFAVINKRSSRKYDVPQIINALNHGDFESKFGADGSLNVTVQNNGMKDMQELLSNVEAIRKQGETTIYTENGQTVMVYKNITRRTR